MCNHARKHCNTQIYNDSRRLIWGRWVNNHPFEGHLRVKMSLPLLAAGVYAGDQWGVLVGGIDECLQDVVLLLQTPPAFLDHLVEDLLQLQVSTVSASVDSGTLGEPDLLHRPLRNVVHILLSLYLKLGRGTH